MLRAIAITACLLIGLFTFGCREKSDSGSSLREQAEAEAKKTINESNMEEELRKLEAEIAAEEAADL